MMNGDGDEILDVGENEIVSPSAVGEQPRWAAPKLENIIVTHAQMEQHEHQGQPTHTPEHYNVHDHPAQRMARQPRLQCGMCERRFSDYEQLAMHVHEGHNVKTSVQTMVLSAWAEFELWKQQVSYCGEFQWRTRHSKKCIYSLVTCHRSGATEHPGRGTRPQRRRVKIGFECCCFAHAKTLQDGSVSVKYCLDHYGHDQDPSLLKQKYPQITVVMDDVDDDDSMDKARVVITQPSTSTRKRSRKSNLKSLTDTLNTPPLVISSQPIVVDMDDLVYEDDAGQGGQIAYGEDGQMYYVIDNEHIVVTTEVVPEEELGDQSAKTELVQQVDDELVEERTPTKSDTEESPRKRRRMARGLARGDEEILDVE